MQTLLKHLLIAGIFVLTSFTLSQAQSEDLRADTVFFQQQSQLYQRWLDHSGIGQYLKVEDMDIQEKQLSLYLSFPFSNMDSIISAWNITKNNFEQDASLSLEQQLFYKAVNLMEVRQSSISVQIYDTYDLREEPLFYRIIYFQDGAVTVDGSIPRDKRRSIHLQARNSNEGKTPSVTEFKNRYSKEKVFDCIYEYARTRYEQTNCEERSPRVRLLEEGDNLRFEVSDLCKEVLRDESNPSLCQLIRLFGNDCNWVKRELLTFTITYEETTTGFRIIILIDGKYGSGYYDTVRRGGYLNMEIDFDDYLEIYADEIKVNIRRMLRDCK